MNSAFIRLFSFNILPKLDEDLLLNDEISIMLKT